MYRIVILSQKDGWLYSPTHSSRYRLKHFVVCRPFTPDCRLSATTQSHFVCHVFPSFSHSFSRIVDIHIDIFLIVPGRDMIHNGQHFLHFPRQPIVLHTTRFVQNPPTGRGIPFPHHTQVQTIVRRRRRRCATQMTARQDIVPQAGGMTHLERYQANMGRGKFHGFDAIVLSHVTVHLQQHVRSVDQIPFRRIPLLHLVAKGGGRNDHDIVRTPVILIFQMGLLLSDKGQPARGMKHAAHGHAVARTIGGAVAVPGQLRGGGKVGGQHLSDQILGQRRTLVERGRNAGPEGGSAVVLSIAIVATTTTTRFEQGQESKIHSIVGRRFLVVDGRGCQFHLTRGHGTGPKRHNFDRHDGTTRQLVTLVEFQIPSRTRSDLGILSVRQFGIEQQRDGALRMDGGRYGTAVRTAPVLETGPSGLTSGQFVGTLLLVVGDCDVVGCRRRRRRRHGGGGGRDLNQLRLLTNVLGDLFQFQSKR
mmetsp:Transcript_10768/g.24025  ORF Transcript_10768/g.24025 Transcript_10768/m.24025 type:complete len:476 (-) Transcript_10768:121-1548(-)